MLSRGEISYISFWGCYVKCYVITYVNDSMGATHGRQQGGARGGECPLLEFENDDVICCSPV